MDVKLNEHATEEAGTHPLEYEETPEPRAETSWSFALERSRISRRKSRVFGGYLRISLAALCVPLFFIMPGAAILWAVAGGYLALSILFMALGKRQDSIVATMVRVVVDVSYVTFVIHGFGSQTTPLLLFYLVIVAAYLLQHGKKIGDVASVLSILSYFTILILENYNILAYGPIASSLMPKLKIYAGSWFPSFVFVAAALVAFYIILRTTAARVESFFRSEHRALAMEKEAAEKLAHIQKQTDETKRLESLGRLAGGLAHDFNNLLTGIVSYSDFVKDAIPKDSSAREDLKVISQAAKRAGELTGQLLAFGRKQIAQTEVLKIGRLLDDLVNILRRTLGEHITVIVEKSQDVWPVRGDPGQIEQVVMNLAINARDAMPRGGALTFGAENVIVGSEPRLRDLDCAYGRFVELTVTDTGIGIPANLLEYIFEPFFTTKKLGEGTGLGLATVYGIVKQYGGCIRVESEPGEGTVFRIYLPAVQETYVTSIPPPAFRSTSSGTILLAEDEEIVRRSTSRILTAKNYDVLEARSGEEALEIAEEYEGLIDLLLTDMVMTGVSGNVLAQRLKESRPDIHVVYMSGYTENAISEHGFINKNTRFVAKPFSAEELLKKISEVLHV